VRHHLDLTRITFTFNADGARLTRVRVQPRPLTLGGIEVETERRALGLDEVPHLDELLLRANDAAVVHIPLIIDGLEFLNLIDEAIYAAAEVQGAERVALLDTSTGLDHVLMIVQQHCGGTVTPLCPRCHEREDPAGGLDEVIPTHLIESIAEIDLKKAQL